MNEEIHTNLPPGATIEQTALGRVLVEPRPPRGFLQKIAGLMDAPYNAVAGFFDPTHSLRVKAANGPKITYVDARDLRTDPAGYIRPSEVERIIVDGKEVERVKSALTVEKAAKALQDAEQAAVKSGGWSRFGKITAGVAAGIVALAASYKGAQWLLGGKKEKDEVSVAPAALSPAMAEEMAPAAEKPQNHWQNRVKAERGQAPQVAGALNPEMNVVPAGKVQDLGAVPVLGK